jgi:hypothetical protein
MTAPFDSNSDERERPSWREIDRRRDRSRHVSRDEPSKRQKSAQSSRAKQQYLKEMEKVFQGARGTKEHQTALNAIHRHYGTNKFSSSVKKYLKTYGLPNDWGTLILLLDFKEHKVAIEAIETLKTLVADRPFMEREGFKNKLEILSLTASSSELISLAEALLKEL